MLRKTLIVALTFLAFTHLWADAVDEYIKAEMKKSRIPGLSLAVVMNGRVVKAAGYGFSNVETQTPATSETAYKIASLSKPIIATAVMLLDQQGRISLDDSVARYLANVPASWANITVRQLLSHTAGLTRDPSDYQPYIEQQPIAVIESTYSLPLQSKPGEKWSYSNIGYYVLAEIITRVTGMQWSDFIAQQLFEPAGMTSTRLTSIPAMIPNRSRGYEVDETGLSNAEDWIAVRPSGAYVSTVLDLAKLDMFLVSRNPLDAVRQAAIMSPAMLPEGKAASYGLGWSLDTYLGEERVSHDGQFPGFRSDWERFPGQRLSVILLANLGSARVQRLVPKIAGFYSPELVSPEFTASVVRSSSLISVGEEAVISVDVRSVSRTAPSSVLELEIWDKSNKSVHKQSRTGEDFAKGETKTYQFTWRPAKSGTYTVNLGIYGAKWNPSYLWSQGMATITVK